MSKNIIEIRNSTFAYKDLETGRERKVLSIDDLEIKAGEITFIVGVSGAGKSTLLETIGLMNDTFPSDMEIGDMSIRFNVFDASIDKAEILDITHPNIWKENGANRLTREKIRKDNYSFIFQNTNLMPNFTALENVCITDMLNNHSFEESYLKALLIFKTLGLGDLELDISPQNISGGQRQRVAFARALIPDYKVLFGDEPTGNLDRKTSYEVMNILYDYLKKTRNQQEDCCVIVSHDLELAKRYADRIIVITKVNGKGEINPKKHIFANTDKKEDELDHFDFKSSIRRSFSSENAEVRLASLRDEIRHKLNRQLNKSGTPYHLDRKYITVNDYLQALYLVLKGEKKNGESDQVFNEELEKEFLDLHHKYILSDRDESGSLFEPELIDYIEELLKINGLSSNKKTHDNTIVQETNNQRWIKPYSHSEKAMSDAQLVQHIEHCLEVDRKAEVFAEQIPEHVKRDQDEAILGDSEVTPVVKRKKIKFKDILFNFFLWLTGLLPDHSKMNPEFTRLFYEKESKELLGYHSRLRNFWTVFILMLVTFLAIGFANGSLIYLGKKMQDPFVNFINVAVPHDHQRDVDIVIDELNRDTAARKQYGINRATGFTIFPLEFVKMGKYALPLITGRTINIKDPILSVLLEPSNVVSGEENGFRSSSDVGIIVSKKMLTDLGYPASAKYVLVHIIGAEGNEADIPVPIRTVLERLPGDLDDEISFLMTDYLHANLVRPITETGKPFSPSNTESLIMFLDSRDSADAERLLVEIQEFLNEHKKMVRIGQSVYRAREPRLLQYKVDSLFYEPGFKLEIAFMGRKPDYMDVRQLFDTLVLSPEISDLPITMLYKQDYYDREMVERAERRLDRLTIHFLKLDRIESFEREYIEPQFPYIRLDMAKIESLKNYNYITKLTRILSFILIVLSVYSIASFLSNVFENHLNKIKMNIGTLMAFGTGGLKLIYRRLMMVFLFIPLLLSLIIASLLGYFGLMRRIMMLQIRNLDEGGFFELWSWGNPLLYTVVAILLIVVFTLMRYKRIITRILSNTPGDLIFNRESNMK